MSTPMPPSEDTALDVFGSPDHLSEPLNKNNDRALSEKARSIQLDFLRGVAILFVLGHHAIVNYNDVGFLRPFFKAWYDIGWSGVDLFFVLSGYLIGGLLMREIFKRHSLDVKRFIIRRGFRIWPLYYGYLTLATLLAMHTEHSVKKGFLDVWTNWVHLQNYPVLGHQTPLFHTWSLSLEEHFYLALPLLLLGLIAYERKNNGDTVKAMTLLPAAACAVFVICLGLRCLNTGPYKLEYRYMTHLRIDSLFFGVLIAYVAEFHKATFAKIGEYRWWLLFAGLALIAPFAFIFENLRYVWTIGFTELYLGYGLILIAVVSSKGKSGITKNVWKAGWTRLVAFIGFYSYPIYLFHIGLGRRPEQVVLNHIHKLPIILQPIVGMISFVFFAVLAGFIIGKLVEKPTLAIRDRMFPPRDITA